MQDRAVVDLDIVGDQVLPSTIQGRWEWRTGLNFKDWAKHAAFDLLGKVTCTVFMGALFIRNEQKLKLRFTLGAKQTDLAGH
ncbi:hypothetical protein [Nitrosomonas sp. ANs5]|uniref:hypothetical protein n=1 Tax=Nitrosomonas sp. ANs5 TaxID=3423941 RepID=UPI003D355B5C